MSIEEIEHFVDNIRSELRELNREYVSAIRSFEVKRNTLESQIATFEYELNRLRQEVKQWNG